MELENSYAHEYYLYVNSYLVTLQLYFHLFTHQNYTSGNKLTIATATLASKIMHSSILSMYSHKGLLLVFF